MTPLTFFAFGDSLISGFVKPAAADRQNSRFFAFAGQLQTAANRRDSIIFFPDLTQSWTVRGENLKTKAFFHVQFL